MYEPVPLNWPTEVLIQMTRYPARKTTRNGRRPVRPRTTASARRREAPTSSTRRRNWDGSDRTGSPRGPGALRPGERRLHTGATRPRGRPPGRPARYGRDRWHTGFVDALGVGGLLGQVEGRTAADVLAWLSTTPLSWRNSIRHVAIDMSATYRAAVLTGHGLRASWRTRRSDLAAT
ncbi:transposase [Streptomyces sp. NPDC046870]|uniref:transposase n=1 Tax=Streptomyces sp. NPDC046870 TaxID=3155135 RepID=UPI003456C44B